MITQNSLMILSLKKKKICYKKQLAATIEMADLILLVELNLYIHLELTVKDQEDL
jgi:hypothetical protein